MTIGKWVFAALVSLAPMAGWAFLPANPRCIVCEQPFEGVGGTLLRMFTGYKPSHNSPKTIWSEPFLPSRE